MCVSAYKALGFNICFCVSYEMNNSNMYMYVCRYVCMYACMYVCMYDICIWMHLRVVRTYVHMHICIYMCIYVYTQIYKDGLLITATSM